MSSTTSASTSTSPGSTPPPQGFQGLQGTPQNPLYGNSGASASNSSSRPRTGTPHSARRTSGRLGRVPTRFTASMQDRQARNKDPYSSDSSSDEELSTRRFDTYGNDSYENIEKRRQAAIILDSPELLMMHSQARGDSIPGTRHYFTKILCGYHDEKDTYPDNGQLPGKEKEKFKRHVSGQSSRK
ncbi:hypothetical protein LZ554_005998 [Drepanopeziza brunnea f. sp. 'monogermtubi']|nr:hypothetical protein LZ554_005998 [Drepanopeziza brunnea f. sp. 'monogermtubi']